MYILLGILAWIISIPIFYVSIKFFVTKGMNNLFWTLGDRVKCIIFSSITPVAILALIITFYLSIALYTDDFWDKEVKW